MVRRATALLLGWYFIVSYGSVTKADFYTQVACEAARSDVLAQIGTTNVKRVSPHCREDVRPPFTATLDGTLQTLPQAVTTPAVKP